MSVGILARARDTEAFAALLDGVRGRANRFPDVVAAARRACEKLEARIEKLSPGTVTLGKVERLATAKVALERVAAIAAMGNAAAGPQGYVLFPGDAVATIVWALCGGSSQGRPSRIHGPPSQVELEILHIMARAISGALSMAFSDQLPEFEFGKIAMAPVKPDAPLGSSSRDVFAINVSVRLLAHDAVLTILLPAAAATSAPVQDCAASRSTADGGALAGSLDLAVLRVEAVLAETRLSLKDLSALRPGDKLAVAADAGALVSIECGGTRLSTGRLGKRGGRLVVEIVGGRNKAGAVD